MARTTKRDGISVEDWLAEVRRVCGTDPEGMTASEMAAIADVKAATMRRNNRKLMDAGKCVCCGRKSFIGIDGIPRRVPAYRMT